MKSALHILTTLCMSVSITACQGQQVSSNTMEYQINKSEEEWKKDLSPEQYYVLRQKGTERAHTGEYNLHFEKGIYTCAGCGEPLFTSENKFESHCGWPSFFDAADKEKIKYIEDRSHGMIRTEIVCAKCGGHLGHIFDDGPAPTGQRYCVNSLSLDFVPSGVEPKK